VKCSIPEITDKPHSEIADELTELRSTLDENIPAKMLDKNILIATWNIRAIGSLTEKWKSEEGEVTIP